MRTLYVYILASKRRVLYVGVTNDLRRRVPQHRTATLGFTAAYQVRRLVYFEAIAGPREAIAREKEIKRWRRAKKVALIRSVNPSWVDLAESWYEARPSDQSGALDPSVARRSLGMTSSSNHVRPR